MVRSYWVYDHSMEFEPTTVLDMLKGVYTVIENEDDIYMCRAFNEEIEKVYYERFGSPINFNDLSAMGAIVEGFDDYRPKHLGYGSGWFSNKFTEEGKKKRLKILKELISKYEKLSEEYWKQS